MPTTGFPQHTPAKSEVCEAAASVEPAMSSPSTDDMTTWQYVLNAPKCKSILAFAVGSTSAIPNASTCVRVRVTINVRVSVRVRVRVKVRVRVPTRVGLGSGLKC